MPAGCGCFKPFDEKSVEVKRMFVADEFRGKGVGRAVLSGLEKWAAEIGYSRMVLEMGNRQPEAAILYRMGYMVIPNYGQYIGMGGNEYLYGEKSISGFPNSAFLPAGQPSAGLIEQMTILLPVVRCYTRGQNKMVTSRIIPSNQPQSTAG